MALSKALHGSRLFSLKANGTGNLTGGTAFLSAVNTGNITGGGPQIQWKVKELLFSRSTNGASDITMSLKDTKTGAIYTVAQVIGFTTGTARIAATLASGEYMVNSDTEIQVTSASLGGGETWNLHIVGQLV